MRSDVDDVWLLQQLDVAFQKSDVDGRAAEAQLIQQAREGDHVAFGVLYRRYVMPIYRYCWLHFGGSREDAEDMTSTVFIRAWQAIGRYDERGRPFLAWLHTIARNVVQDELRRAGRTMSLDDILPDPSNVADLGTSRLDHERLARALTHLAPDQRQVVICQFLLGYATEETAAVLGKRAGAIRAIQMRALRTLRELLGRDV
ncbi:MAG: hypothetical protein CYG59_12505 [Chloroflexi bacterium]|nr:MAG: hypothetical protein CYG59_12505 [Chloroflexota bacterium]